MITIQQGSTHQKIDKKLMKKKSFKRRKWRSI